MIKLILLGSLIILVPTFSNSQDIYLEKEESTKRKVFIHSNNNDTLLVGVINIENPDTIHLHSVMILIKNTKKYEEVVYTNIMPCTCEISPTVFQIRNSEETYKKEEVYTEVKKRYRFKKSKMYELVKGKKRYFGKKNVELKNKIKVISVDVLGNQMVKYYKFNWLMKNFPNCGENLGDC